MPIPKQKRYSRGYTCVAGRDGKQAILQSISQFYNGRTRILKSCQKCRDYNNAQQRRRREIKALPSIGDLSPVRREQLRRWAAGLTGRI